MSTVGIIAEYNPFHRGHEYHIAKAKEITGADRVVVIMSGDFVQRGGPAVCDKYIRTHMALSCGADVVLELPVRYATSSAEGFAMGAVSLLSRLGSVDYLCFGTEGDPESAGCCYENDEKESVYRDSLLDKLMTLARLLVDEPVEYCSILKDHLKKGLSYPTAREKALEAYTHDEVLTDMIRSPNNILAVEYCKAILRLANKNIEGLHIPKPVPILRIGAGYHGSCDPDGGFNSAEGIRRVISGGFGSEYPEEFMVKAVPASCNELMRDCYGKKFPVHIDMFSDMLFMRLRSTDHDRLLACADVTKDLLNGVLHALDPALSFSELAMKVKTKNLTYSGISRALLHMMLGIGKEDATPTVRILGFRQSSSTFLKQNSGSCSVRLITKLADADREDPIFKENIFASECYSRAVFTQYGIRQPSEYERKIIIV